MNRMQPCQESSWYNPVTGESKRCFRKNRSTPVKDTGALYEDYDWEITEGVDSFAVIRFP